MVLSKNSTKRGPCKECPWSKLDRHSLKWPSYVEKMNASNLIINSLHKCHMIDHKVWEKPYYDNVCIGSLNK